MAAGACAWFSSNIADILEFVYDFWAPSMVLPFMVAVFGYRVHRIHAVVVSMVTGVVAAVLWRFVLHSPADVGPALFGFAVAVVVFFVALPITSRHPRGRLFRPDDGASTNRVDGADRTGRTGEDMP